MKPKTVSRRSSSEGEETEIETVASGSREELVDVISKQGISRLGNGQDEELSRSQLSLIYQLYDRVAPYREALPDYDREWCDVECVRRYLVARSWSLEKAEEQLTNTLKWRAKDKPAAKEFCQATKAANNPFALSMRLVGWDLDGRPICYTRFSEANDRWDPEANMEHTMLLLEANSKLIRKRQKMGLNQTADMRQCIWVVDFCGFGFRDQNPKTAFLTAALLQHYPEMLNLVVLVDAPLLFNGLWKLASPLLDDRVRRKFMFVKGKQADTVLKERLGSEAADWVQRETKDCDDKMRQKGVTRKYWIPPEQKGQHDSRGLSSYVHSDLYIKTPGEAFEEAKQGKLKPMLAKPKEVDVNNVETPVIRPTLTKTIYSGTF